MRATAHRRQNSGAQRVRATSSASTTNLGEWCRFGLQGHWPGVAGLCSRAELAEHLAWGQGVQAVEPTKCPLKKATSASNHSSQREKLSAMSAYVSHVAHDRKSRASVLPSWAPGVQSHRQKTQSWTPRTGTSSYLKHPQSWITIIDPQTSWQI